MDPAVPKFLSKSERERLALERRAHEIAQKRRAFASLVATNHATDVERQQVFESDIPEVPLDVRRREIEDIKKRYLNPGEMVSSTRHGRSSEKRLMFEWSAKDDTSDTRHDIYGKRVGSIRFGRGQLGRSDESLDVFSASKRHKLEDTDKHWREKSLEEMTDRDWRIVKEDFDISTKGGSIPHPMRLWRESGLSFRLQEALGKFGYREPTPIQRQSIPIVLKGRDMIGVAETGSGKTLAFLLPFFDQVDDFRLLVGRVEGAGSDRTSGPVGLVLAPTRELVLQIENEYGRFARTVGRAPPVAIVGGHSMTGQSFRLSEGVVDMVIATPGRLKDCLEQHVLSLGSVRYLVLDEADRMVDMGFEEDLTAILSRLGRAIHSVHGQASYETPRVAIHVQKVLFSATMPPAVERIARTYLASHPDLDRGSLRSGPGAAARASGLGPAVVTIGTAGQAVDRIEQRAEMVASEHQKRIRLFGILAEHYAGTTEDDPEPKDATGDLDRGRDNKRDSYGAHGGRPSLGPVIIFVNHKETVDSVTRHLNSRGYRSIGLHGGRSQEQRESALQQLKTGKVSLLVATDVASRGIDIPNVSLVLNYDMAPSIESYIHRIGRTGRAGKEGVAHTFLLPAQDAPLFYDLKALLLKSPKSVCPRELSEHEAAHTKPGTLPQKKKSDETIFK